MSFRKKAIDGASVGCFVSMADSQISLNGRSLNAAAMSDVSSFVEQDDQREIQTLFPY